METGSGIKFLDIRAEGKKAVSVTVDMGEPELTSELPERIVIDGEPHEFVGISMGNPHGVLRVADVVGPRDAVGQVEAQTLAVMLQAPTLLPADQVAALPDDAFHAPALQSVWDVMLAAATLPDAVAGTLSPARYLDQVLEIAGETVRPLIVELTTLQLPARTEEALSRLAVSLLERLSELALAREYTVLKQRLQRTGPEDPERYQETLARLAQVQERRRRLRHTED